MSRNKIATTVYLTAEQSELLQMLHETTDVPTAVYIRQGVDMILGINKQNMPGQLSFGDARKNTTTMSPEVFNTCKTEKLPHRPKPGDHVTVIREYRDHYRDLMADELMIDLLVVKTCPGRTGLILVENTQKHRIKVSSSHVCRHTLENTNEECR